MLDKMPEVFTLQDGSKYWEHTFDDFHAKIYLPEAKPIADIVNFGFRAPYLLVFEENKQSIEEAKKYADASGLTEIAKEFYGSVVFIYPTCDGGWDNAPADLYTNIIANSRISQYYKDGVAIMRDRFTGNWNGFYIRGTVVRAHLYGKGKAADYIAKYCLKQTEGDGLYGKCNIAPVSCTLQNLSIVPAPAEDAKDIIVISIDNSQEINDALRDKENGVNLCHARLTPAPDPIHLNFKEDFVTCDRNHRMMGNIVRQENLDEIGMVCEPGYCIVPTSKDNLGDDKNTEEHAIGYLAYYNKGLTESGEKLPLLFCFHGGGDSAFCMTNVSGWFKVANKYNFLLISIEHHMNSTATEVMAVLNQLKDKYPVDTERIYSTGFSMGGCKSWDICQEYPKAVAGIAPMSATFEVGFNVFAQNVEPINRDIVVPTFYVGGAVTPLPELPFQAQKCIDRVNYVFDINKVKTTYDVKLEDKDNWKNPIYGIDGDVVYHLDDSSRGSVLTINLFESENGHCYTVFGSVDNQGHEVRHHSCENAWKFLSQFRRLPDGSVVGGKMDEIKKLYEA